MINIFKTSQTVFNLNDFAKILGEINYDNLKSKIFYYEKKGYINRIRKGIYVKDNFDKYELVCKIYSPSYISYETVLYHEGFIYQYQETIYAASYLSRYLEINYKDKLIKIQYRKIKDGILLDNNGIINKQYFNIASGNRAIADMKYLKSDFYFDKLPNGYKKT